MPYTQYIQIFLYHHYRWWANYKGAHPKQRFYSAYHLSWSWWNSVSYSQSISLNKELTTWRIMNHLARSWLEILIRLGINWIVTYYCLPFLIRSILWYKSMHLLHACVCKYVYLSKYMHIYTLKTNFHEQCNSWVYSTLFLEKLKSFLKFYENGEHKNHCFTLWLHHNYYFDSIIFTIFYKFPIFDYLF